MSFKPPANANEEPIGVNVTDQVNEEMAKISIPKIPLMDNFGIGALRVALEHYSEHGRGMVLGLERRGMKKFLYVPKADSALTLWMSNVSMKRRVKQAIADYDPNIEAIVVMVAPPTVHLYLARGNEQIKILEVQEVEQTKFQLPSGVSSRKEIRGTDAAYTYTHKKLGKLGRIILRSVGAQTLVSFELAKSGFDPRAKEREEIFKPLANELMERLELGLMR